MLNGRYHVCVHPQGPEMLPTECSFLADLKAGVFQCHQWSSLLVELSPPAWNGAQPDVLPTSHLRGRPFSLQLGEFSLQAVEAPGGAEVLFPLPCPEPKGS